MVKKLNWSNLKKMLCPKCAYDLAKERNMRFPNDVSYKCQKEKCDFKISKASFERIIEDLYKPRIRYHD